MFISFPFQILQFEIFHLIFIFYLLFLASGNLAHFGFHGSYRTSVLGKMVSKGYFFYFVRIASQFCLFRDISSICLKCFFHGSCFMEWKFWILFHFYALLLVLGTYI